MRNIRGIFNLRLQAILLTLALISSACYGEVNPGVSMADDSRTQSDDSGKSGVVMNAAAFADADESTRKNEQNTREKTGATSIALNDASTRISGPGAAFSDGKLVIRQAGDYVLSGELKNGQILVNVKKNDIVRITLNGVTLHNETGPAIYAPKSKELALILEKGTKNTISDGSSYAASKDVNDPNAAIFVQDSLGITGDGNLSVTGNHKHGIRAQDILTITGGVISVRSVGDALRGRDGVDIKNGSFTLDAGGDGIISNNDKDEAKGYVRIDGGTFVINAKNDGIQAKSTLTISGGVFQITTGGGSAKAPVHPGRFGGGWGGGWGSSRSSNAASVSRKALKAGKLVYITGGDFTIDAEDDAVHSNDNIEIKSGKFTIKTGDDGMHADKTLEVSGGDIDIIICYEGLEGLNVTISGGNISIVSNDDAINAAEGNDNASGGRGRWGGWSAMNENVFVHITGGTIELYAGTDGIDANGNIFIDGGVIKISGPSMVVEGAIDYDGGLYITGGELITAGSVIGVSSDSTQPAILVSYAKQYAPGSVITINDSKGKTLLEYTSKIDFYMSGFSSPSFEVGETYSLLINGEKRTDIKLNGIVTSIGDNGGSYNGGWGGWGGWGGGGFGGPGRSGGGAPPKPPGRGGSKPGGGPRRI